MEVVKIAGVDPGLRFTGYGSVNYNTETNEIWVDNCGLLKTPAKFKGIDAILYMRDQLKEISSKECFSKSDHIVVEMPAAIYSKSFSSGSLLPVAAISGCVFSLLDPKKIIPVYPAVWNEHKRKEKTKILTEETLGSHENWSYESIPKAKGQFEHIIDAVSMALWYMRLNYLEQ